MEEMFDIYTREGKHIGTKPKSICHSKNPGFYHKPVWIWIINSKNEVLVQKRSSYKKTSPNLYDMSCAGHVKAKESSIEGAIRETYEELGIKTDKSDYKFLGKYIDDKNFEIAQIYLLKLHLNISDFKLEQKEVSEVKWLGFNQFKKLLYSDKFVSHDKEYKNLVIELILKNFDN